MSDQQDFPSDSGLPLAEHCAASVVLPRPRIGMGMFGGGAAIVGSAIHEHMHLRVTLGLSEAMAQLDAVADRWRLEGVDRAVFLKRCREFEWVPPSGAMAEVQLVFVGDEVTRVEGGRGVYRLPPGAMHPGTLDVMWAEPAPLRFDGHRATCPPESTLWVADYKTGSDAWVEPVDGNLQVGSLTAKAARWTGATRVVPAIIYVRDGQGEWDVPPKPWGQQELAAIMDRLERVRLEVAAQRERLQPTEGPHCRWCPARSSCPAKVAELRAIIESPEVGPLSAEERTRLAHLLPQVRRLGAQLEELLRASVEAEGPIPLGDGTFWGPREHQRTSVTATVALPILIEELGADGAMAAVSLTKAAIGKTVSGLVPRGKATSTMGRILARIGAAGGLVCEPSVRWEVYRDEISRTNSSHATPEDFEV